MRKITWTDKREISTANNMPPGTHAEIYKDAGEYIVDIDMNASKIYKRYKTLESAKRFGSKFILNVLTERLRI